jgi:hypothetical protein
VLASGPAGPPPEEPNVPSGTERALVHALAELFCVRTRAPQSAGRPKRDHRVLWFRAAVPDGRLQPETLPAAANLATPRFFYGSRVKCNFHPPSGENSYDKVQHDTRAKPPSAFAEDRPLVCRRAPRRPRWPFYGKWNGVKTRMGKTLVRFVTPPGSLTSSNTSPICRTI